MIVQTNTDFFDDICEVVRLFFPFATFDSKEQMKLDVFSNLINNTLTTEVSVGSSATTNHTFKSMLSPFANEMEQKKVLKREIKLAVYQALSKHTGIEKDWGSHTGVRPTKIAYELLDNGKSINEMKSYLINKFSMNPEKVNLVCDVISNQGKLTTDDNFVHFYVHIPFCPTRCSYCSFITFDNKCSSQLMESYLDSLIYEIEETKKIIHKNAYVVQSVYIGGGTPTTLSAGQLDKLLSHITFKTKEFTVECGRPDTITHEKLQVLQKHDVSRICINPQTFKDQTLELIGRKHNSQQTINAIEIARHFDFSINMDLIAGLPKETFTDFKNSLNIALSLNPESITVHTLSIKNGTDLFGDGLSENMEAEVTQMVNHAREVLAQNGYLPYYLYRQKHQLSSQENIGYTKPGFACKFNIESMEETSTIIACGAGAISKRVFHNENRLERCANIKSVPIYLERLQEVIKRKNTLFEQEDK